MVQYINPIRPQAAPVAQIDGYYRPILDNTNSRGLEKLAAALGNLRKPFNDISQNALQQQQNQLQMMRMEQNLELQQQENAFRLFKAERDFRAAELREKTADANEFLRTITTDGDTRFGILQQLFELGEPLFTTNVFSGTRAGKITMDGDELPDGVLNPDMRALLDGAGLETGIDVRLVNPREAMGNTTANIVLVDSSTGKPVPMDGSDPRASNYATVLQALGAADIRTSGGDVLSVGLEALQGDRPEWLVNATENADLRNNITEVTPADWLTTVRQFNAQLIAEAEAGLRSLGYETEQMGQVPLMQRLLMESAAREEQARITTVQAQQDADVELLRADAEGIGTRLLADENILSDEELVAAFESDDPETNIMSVWARLLQDEARAMGYDDRIISRALLPSEIVKEKYGYGELQKRYISIIKGQDEARRFARFNVSINEFLKTAGDNKLPANVLTEAFFFRAEQAGLSRAKALEQFVSLSELLDFSAESSSATDADVVNAENARNTLEQLRRSGAFLQKERSLVNRVEKLLQEDDATERFSRSITSRGNRIKMLSEGGAGSVKILETIRGIETEFAPFLGLLDENQLEDYQAMQSSGVEAVETARGEEEANWEIPVQRSYQDVTIAGVTLQTSEVLYGTPDINRQIREKQGSWIAQYGPMLVGMQEGDTEAMQDFRTGFTAAQRNGYSEGLLARVASEQFPDGFSAEDIPAAATLLSISQDPKRDFAGNIEMQFYAQVNVSQDARANIAAGAQVLSRIDIDEDLTKLEAAFGYLPVNERRAAAMSLLASNATKIIATENTGKVIDKLAKKTKPVQFIRGLDRVTPGDPLALNISAAFGSSVLNYSVNAPDGEAERLAAKYGMSATELREAVVANLPAVFGSVPLKDDDTNERLITDLPDNRNMTVVFSGERIYLHGKNNMPVQVQRGANGVPSPAAILAVTNTNDMETSTKRVRAVDVEEQVTTEMFVLNKIDEGYTYDINNVRGPITATVTFTKPGNPEPQTAEAVLDASAFLPITADGYAAFEGHGAYAYMLPARALAVDGVIESVDVQVGYSIGLNDPESQDYSTVSTSTATFFDSKRNADRYTIIEGVTE